MLVADPITAPYTTKIIKAGALLPDTKLLLEQWDEALGSLANLERMRLENAFGKSSRSRVADMLAIFRQRYLREPEVARALVALVKGRMPAASLDRILYFLAARSDSLLHDVVIEVLAPLAARGRQEISVGEIEAWIRGQIAAGKTAGAWGTETIERVSQGVMATLRDFGVLAGAVQKRLAPAYLPSSAFAFIAFLLNREQRSGDRLLHDPAWQLFFLAPQAVERFFIEAHQERLLSYYAAGPVIRLEFPASRLQEYAHVLLTRAH